MLKQFSLFYCLNLIAVLSTLDEILLCPQPEALIMCLINLQFENIGLSSSLASCCCCIVGIVVVVIVVVIGPGDAFVSLCVQDEGREEREIEIVLWLNNC